MTTACCYNCDDSSTPAGCSADAVIATSPDAIAILNELNIDTCCGGLAYIGEAATRAHVTPQWLIGRLMAASCEIVAVISGTACRRDFAAGDPRFAVQ